MAARQVNFLGAYTLTRLLAGTLASSAPSRVARRFPEPPFCVVDLALHPGGMRRRLRAPARRLWKRLLECSVARHVHCWCAVPDKSGQPLCHPASVQLSGAKPVGTVAHSQSVPWRQASSPWWHVALSHSAARGQESGTHSGGHWTLWPGSHSEFQDEAAGGRAREPPHSGRLGLGGKRVL